MAFYIGKRGREILVRLALLEILLSLWYIPEFGRIYGGRRLFDGMHACIVKIPRI